ncbi:MAG TPA: alpha-L-arabinofuranosidase C-terminal domain-containing protein [Thermoguttaceae bacterium]|nr:alpha-L-arabinofuranosidase C-terminal domain-containing protein [Thermoguttaceae bacterium]
MNHRVIIPFVIAGLVLLLGFAPTAPAAAPAADDSAANLLPNPSFEEEADGKPAGWQTQSWSGEGEFGYAAAGRTGRRCLTISSDGGADIGWFAIVPVEPHASYRLSGWIKTENVAPAPGGRAAKGALLNLHNIQSIQTKAVSGTSDWTKVEVLFETGGEDAVQVNCLFGGWGLATGKAFFDDIRLEKLSIENWQPSIAIDARKTGEPISKYIYGQFIEHLGRCIYGGIWAEMLEDRKFYYAPGEKDSPWQPLDENSVEMVKEDSFVGEQTPKIAPGKGIRQGGLGVVKGKTYAGYVWLKASDKPVSVDISLSYGATGREQGVTLLKVSNEYTRYCFEFPVGATTDDATLTIKVDGGSCHVGTVSLMPADNVDGMRPDTLELLKELDSPVYRWPGGNFVSGYDWKDGIGPRDRRPPRKNPAWTGVEHNDFGIDEFIHFCRVLNTEPYIAVNSGLGGVKNAVEELQYANGGPDTPLGKLRAQNGHAEPYGVKWWGIGNEMYGGWQLGHMPLEQYVLKHNEFAEAMRAEDPSIKLVAVGDAGRWSEMMMQQCADHMDLISEHFYRQSRPGLSSHVQQIPDAVRAKADAHRDYRRRLDALNGKDIRIALDEWNFWYGPHVYGELGTRYFLQDALGIAAGLNEYARQSDIIFMANYAQTVNVIGCIKTSKTAASFATTGLALKLYRHHFGVIPVEVTAAPPLDAMAAWSEDRKTLTVAVVNATMRELEIDFAVQGAKLTGAGTRWQIAGNDPMAYNEPGKEPNVKIEESPVSGIKDKLPVAPCSVTLFGLEVE